MLVACHAPVRSNWQAEALCFFIGLSVRPPFVRLLSNLWTRYFENKCIDFDAN